LIDTHPQFLTKNLIQNMFLEDGFVVVKNVISQLKANYLISQIKKNIHNCASELHISVDDYLSSVSRWVNPSPVTANTMTGIENKLQEVVTKLLGEESELKKWNVICKNVHNFGSIPFHQDISYSPQSPYQISAWLALNNIDKNSSPLEILPGTHKRKVKSAVDFWSINYVSEKKNGLKLPVEAGDVIFFDSRVWHGSSKSDSFADRYAIVSRWATPGFKPNYSIPEIQPLKFGMWTCGKETENILIQGAKKVLNKKETSLASLINLWIHALNKKTLPFKVETNTAITALQKIKILHLAHLNHKGGDATGILYKDLWYSFLEPLETYTKREM